MAPYFSFVFFNRMVRVKRSKNKIRSPAEHRSHEEQEEELYLEEEERYTPLSSRWVTDNDGIPVEEEIPDLADLERATEFHVVDRHYRSRERYKRIVLACGILFVLSTVIGVSVALSRNNKSSSVSYYQVPSPPPELDVVCDISSVETTDGHAACQRYCEPATCCFDRMQNCKLENQKVCEMYATCLLLTAYSGMEVLEQDDASNNIYDAEGFLLSEAPSNINAICSKESRATFDGNKQCDEICRAAACCETSCSSSPKCAQYFICFAVDVLDVIVSSSTSNTTPMAENTDNEIGIMELCEDIHNPGCIQECQERECCFRTTGYNCYNDSTTWCDDYAICVNLPIWQSLNQQFQTNLTSSSTISDFKLKCSLYQSDNDLSECQKLCDERSCCFTVDGCLDESICHESFECINLPNFEEVYNKAHGIKPIFTTNATMTTTKTEDSSIIALNAACSATNIDANGTNDCENLCKHRACCFVTDDNNQSRNCADNQDLKAWCDEYSACQILVLYSNSNIDTVTTESSSSTNIAITAPDNSAVTAAVAVNAVNEACSSDVIAVSGKSLCQELCDDRACCFVKELALNCQDELRDWCLEYSACNVLMHVAANTSAAANAVTSACSLDVLAESPTACQELCDDRACCFAHGKFNCADELHDWCLEYSACNGLTTWKNTNNSTSASAAPEVENACDASKIQDSVLASECTKLCSARSCCFADTGNDNCYKLNSKWCDEYKACWNLPQYNGDMGYPNAGSTIPSMNTPAPSSTPVEPLPSTPEDVSGNHIVGHLGKFGVLAYDSSSTAAQVAHAKGLGKGSN